MEGTMKLTKHYSHFFISISSAFTILWPDSLNARFFWGSEVGGVMRIAKGNLGRELLMVQDGSVAACATQPSHPWRGVGVETCNQSLIF